MRISKGGKYDQNNKFDSTEFPPLYKIRCPQSQFLELVCSTNYVSTIIRVILTNAWLCGNCLTVVSKE